LLLGYAGLASLGTAGFVGVGTYLTGYLLKVAQLPYLLVLVICILVAIVLGVIVGFISLRIEGMYLAIITLGLSEILVELFKNLDTITNGVNGLLLGVTPSILGWALTRENTFYLICIFLVLLLIITWNIIKSPTGRAMLAMKNSESAAQAMGVNLLKYRLLAFVLATVFSMVGGFLYMTYYRFTIPSTWTLSFSLNILAAVVVGGGYSLWGILGGTFVIFGLNDILLQRIPFFIQNPGYTMAFNGILMIVIVMFYPGGLTQLFRELSYRFKQWRLKKGRKLHEKK
jgi:branched-chain amino acid transport system permease protein